MRAVADCWVVPVSSIQAEEQFDVAQSVGEGAEHVAKKEVTELDWVNASQKKSPVAVQEPTSRAMVKVGGWKNKSSHRQADQDDRPVFIHWLASELVEI